MRDFLSYWKDTADAPDTKTKFMVTSNSKIKWKSTFSQI
jgi:hypothetical protein